MQDALHNSFYQFCDKSDKIKYWQKRFTPIQVPVVGSGRSSTWMISSTTSRTIKWSLDNVMESKVASSDVTVVDMFDSQVLLLVL